VALAAQPRDAHADYIGSWLEVLREDNRAIVRAASAASKAADYILGFQSETSEAGAAIAADDEREAA
jgi:antirestriction protein ArdC